MIPKAEELSEIIAFKPQLFNEKVNLAKFLTAEKCSGAMNELELVLMLRRFLSRTELIEPDDKLILTSG